MVKGIVTTGKLIGDYYKRGLPWEEFEFRFREYLAHSDMKEILSKLAGRAKYQTVTILCIESTPERCHRRIVAEECQKMDPTLEVHIA